MVNVDGEEKVTKMILPRQQAIHDSTAKFTLFSGGVGTGKTYAMCVQMIWFALTFPGIHEYVICPYDYYFDEFLMPTWTSIVPFDDYRITSYNKQKHILNWINGSRTTFKSFDEGAKVKGFECHIVWIEEASELGDANNEKAMQIWTALLMRLRAPDKIYNGKIVLRYQRRVYVTQNPKGHNWVWKLFVKNSPDGEIGSVVELPPSQSEPKGSIMSVWNYQAPNGDSYYTIATASTDNPFLPVGYVETMLDTMAATPEVKARMVEGKFSPIHGLVYPPSIFSPQTHVISRAVFLLRWEITDIPAWWPVYVGIDPAGLKSPWAVEFYVETPDGEVVCFDEIYKRDMTYAQIAPLILDKIAPFNSVRCFIDPIMGRMYGHNAETLQMEFRRYGIECRLPKGYGKANGIFRIYELLKLDKTRRSPYLNDHELPNGSYEIGAASLYYLEGAAVANLKEKEVYRFDSRRQRSVKEFEEGLTPYQSEKVVDRDDHAQTAEMFALLGFRPLPVGFDAGSKIVGTPQIRYKSIRPARRLNSYENDYEEGETP